MSPWIVAGLKRQPESKTRRECVSRDASDRVGNDYRPQTVTTSESFIPDCCDRVRDCYCLQSCAMGERDIPDDRDRVGDDHLCHETPTEREEPNAGDTVWNRHRGVVARDAGDGPSWVVPRLEGQPEPKTERECSIADRVDCAWEIDSLEVGSLEGVGTDGSHRG